MRLALRWLVTGEASRLRTDEWAGDTIFVQREVFQPEQVDGFVAESWAGAVTDIVRDDGCEIISLNSLEPNRGIGSALTDAVVEHARRQACRRVLLSTTNDNLHAPGFYQSWGFAIAAVRPGVLNETRRRKPGIPLVGEKRHFSSRRDRTRNAPARRMTKICAAAVSQRYQPATCTCI